MANRKRFWAVAYGNVIRYSEAPTAGAAARDCYGVVDTSRMTAVRMPRNPARMAQYRKAEVLEVLAKRHKEKTGYVIK